MTGQTEAFDLMTVVDRYHETKNRADKLVGSVLRLHLDDIPKEHAEWLMRFLRVNMTPQKLRMVRDGWSLPPRWPNHKPMDDSQIPF
jgi:hypothetical protein